MQDETHTYNTHKYDLLCVRIYDLLGVRIYMLLCVLIYSALGGFVPKIMECSYF